MNGTFLWPPNLAFSGKNGNADTNGRPPEGDVDGGGGGGGCTETQHFIKYSVRGVQSYPVQPPHTVTLKHTYALCGVGWKCNSNREAGAGPILKADVVHFEFEALLQ